MEAEVCKKTIRASRIKIMIRNSDDEFDLRLSQLSRWGREYVLHLREHRPSDYAELAASGQIISQAQIVAGNADQEFDLRYEQMLGYHSPAIAHQIAWEQIEREYIYLPDEKSVPVLGDVSELPEEPIAEFDSEHLETLQGVDEAMTDIETIISQEQE